MDSPLCSIIVPIYNSAIDLVPCLESIKRQKYANLEILLVNDGSSDSSLTPSRARRGGRSPRRSRPPRRAGWP